MKIKRLRIKIKRLKDHYLTGKSLDHIDIGIDKSPGNWISDHSQEEPRGLIIVMMVAY